MFTNNYHIYLVEIGPLVSEYIFYYWLLSWGYRRGKFVEPFSTWRVMLIAIVGNILTLSMGIVLALVGAA